MGTFINTTASYRHGATTLPGKYYSTLEVFAREREHMLSTQWFCIGRTEQVAEPGQYFLQDIGGESVIILRDKRGNLRAFFNVCRHRGTKLCDVERGRVSESIQCPYHAWTYATDGRLIGAPMMNEVDGFDKKDYPLHKVGLAEWEGFLFVNLGKEPQPFEEAFAPLIGRFGDHNLSRVIVGKRIAYDVKSNWKLIFQNYSECLHCPSIHPELSDKLPYLSGANDLISGPFLGGCMLISAPHESATMSGRACGLPLGNLSEEHQHRAFYYSMLPNLLLSLHPDYAVAYTLWPKAPALTVVVCEWMFHPDSFGRPDFNPDDAVELWDVTNRQDWHVSELTMAGVSSRAYTPGPYSARESMPAAFDQAYLAMMGETTRE